MNRLGSDVAAMKKGREKSIIVMMSLTIDLLLPTQKGNACILEQSFFSFQTRSFSMKHSH